MFRLPLLVFLWLLHLCVIYPCSDFPSWCFFGYYICALFIHVQTSPLGVSLVITSVRYLSMFRLPLLVFLWLLHLCVIYPCSDFPSWCFFGYYICALFIHVQTSPLGVSLVITSVRYLSMFRLPLLVFLWLLHLCVIYPCSDFPSWCFFGYYICALFIHVQTSPLGISLVITSVRYLSMFRLPLLVFLWLLHLCVIYPCSDFPSWCFFGYYICALFIHVQTSPLGISLVITSVRYLSMFRLPLLVFLWLLHLCVIYPCSDFPSWYFFGYYICALFIHVQTSPLGISLVITSVRYLSMFRLPLLVFLWLLHLCVIYPCSDFPSWYFFGYYICALFIHVQTSPLGISLVITSVRYLSMFRLPLLVFLWLLHLCVIYPCSDFPSWCFFGYYICALFIHVQTSPLGISLVITSVRYLSMFRLPLLVFLWLLHLCVIYPCSGEAEPRDLDVRGAWSRGEMAATSGRSHANLHQGRARGIARGKCTQCVDGCRGGGGSIIDVLGVLREVLFLILDSVLLFKKNPFFSEATF